MALTRNLLLFVACFAIAVINAAPRKGKDGHRKEERPTLAPGETRSPDDSGSNSHDLDSAGYTHDPLHQGRPPRRPRDARGGDKKDRPTLPPGETLPPHESHSRDGDHSEHPLGDRPTVVPGFHPRGPPLPRDRKERRS